MHYHRFEDYESVVLTPHLSSGRSPIIEGKYLYYCLNQKEAGTGSELHYHPNELLIFLIQGKANGVVGKDRRIITPGTFVLVPPNVRHSFKATEDGPCAYLYIKDMTWTVVGIAADEALPEQAMAVGEANAKFDAGEIVDRKGKNTGDNGTGSPENVIIDGVPDCFYQILQSLDQPLGVGRRIEWIKGERSAFGFFELPSGYSEEAEASEHEQFFYVLQGQVDATVDNDSQSVSNDGIIQIPKGSSYSLKVQPDAPTRLVAVRSTHFLENKVI